ncbi:DUF3108 domain-containing protein [Ramlibacter albus]|uniref:DUF3108 domain-containing protein n=1 Tax=Ramlibacter albus TaxID=2079448 RepID=A0A923S3X9_9BURK|nr:DUF3108 domain-containing protein [Ramlibacter albus]MBC5763552.1 DUF3108 domain-containing protein [Ramlibacter albus]
MTDRRAPPEKLALLAAVVLVSHAVLLDLAPAAISLARPQQLPTHAFTTRVIEAPRPAAPAPAPRPVAQAPQAKPAVAPQPKPEPSPAAPVSAAPATAEAAAPAPEPQVAATAQPNIPFTPGTDVELGKVDAADVNATQAYAIPESVRMKYELVAERFGLTLRSTAELLWRHDGRQYEAVLEAGGGMFPKRVQRSTGLLTSEGLAPVRFSDRSRNEAATHFVRGEKRIVFSNNKPDAPLPPGVQDRLSIVVQLCAMVGGAPQRFPKGTTLTVPTASTSEVENWIFTVEGEEVLDLPAGKMPGLKLQRAPRREYDVKVELWLAPGLDYAPVRLRLTNPNGDSVDQRWSGADRP